MGFGALSEGDSFGSTTLQEVTVNAVSHDTCNAQYNGEIVEDIMLCAGVPGGGKDSCQGDSGGPIINSDGVQVGIVSWGYGCGRPEFSGVYSRISGAIDWINEQICDLSDNPPASCGNGGGNGGGTNPPATGSVQVQYKIFFDNYPEEAGLSITSATGETVVNYPTGSFSGSTGGIFTETISLAPGDYELEITDSFGDGLCCEFGQGRFEIQIVGPDSDAIVLAEGDAEFSDSKLVQFSVPSTTSNDCEDQNESLLVDSEVGNADCAWLSTNLDRYGYLCQFLDVAAICPQTCDTCAYFQ